MAVATLTLTGGRSMHVREPLHARVETLRCVAQGRTVSFFGADIGTLLTLT
jgi:hypothetical protein